MIVCPNCRTANEEHARFCQTCGRSLDPGPSPRVRPEGGTSGLAEIRPPKPPARWPAIVVVVALIVFAGAFFGYKEFGPDPCRGKFASPQFGYCLTVPNGWQAKTGMMPTFASGRSLYPRAVAAGLRRSTTEGMSVRVSVSVTVAPSLDV